MDLKTASAALTHLLALIDVAMGENGARHHHLIFKSAPTKNGTSAFARFEPTEKFWLKVRLLAPFVSHLPGIMHDTSIYCISGILRDQEKNIPIRIDLQSKLKIEVQIVMKMHEAFLELDKLRRDIEEPFI